MKQRAAGTFEVKSWDEEPFDEIDEGPRLARARVTKSFSGEIRGESILEYLIVHRGDGSASFVGVERFIGRLADRSGSFVLQHVGSFEEGTAKASCEVVAGSGTGELGGLRGAASFLTRGRQAPITLEYELG